MKRKVKELQDKSRLHSILDMGNTNYKLVSGTSGETYHLHVKPKTDSTDATISCTCPFGLFRRDYICSHKTAVINFRAEQAGYRVMIWQDDEDAERQHRRHGTLQGISWTVRKVETSIQPTLKKGQPKAKTVAPPSFVLQIWWHDRNPEDVLDDTMLHGTADEDYAMADIKIAKPSNGWSFEPTKATFDSIRAFMDSKELQATSSDIIGYRWKGRKEWLYNIRVEAV